MVASLTERRPSDTKELSELVGRKTGRNAFFVSQYMEDLQRESLLAFSFQSNRWEWDLEQIKGRTDVSDNVVALLTKKINSMPDDVQTVLMMASCLGFVVDANALEQIVLIVGLLALDKTPSRKKVQDSVEASQPEDSGKSAAGTEINADKAEESKRYLAAYEKAVNEGLIEKIGYGKFKFSHDRVQQAAYGLLPTGEEGVQLHLRVGDILLRMSRTVKGEQWVSRPGDSVIGSSLLSSILTLSIPLYLQRRCSLLASIY
jgi:predicted ATPase